MSRRSPSSYAQEARRHTLRLHQSAEHLDESLVPPERLVVQERIRACLPGRLVLVERLQRIPAEAEEIRGQSGPHQRLAPRLRHGQEDALDLRRLVRRKDARLAELDAGHPTREERLPHPVGLGVGPHQDGDVPSRERCRPDAGLVSTCRREKPRNLGRRGLDGSGRGLLLGHRLTFARAGEAPDPERRLVVRRDDERPSLLLGRPHRMERDLVEQERVSGPPEDGVYRPDQPGSGAPVSIQRASRLRVATRRQIREDVRPPETEDGLLGIPHQKDREPASGVDLPEDRVLGGVGVLKLVDQRRGIMPAQAGGQRRAVRGRERAIQTQQEVLIRRELPAFLPCGQLPPAVLE